MARPLHYPCTMGRISGPRAVRSGNAIAITYLDAPLPEAAAKALAETGLFEQIRPLRFEI